MKRFNRPFDLDDLLGILPWVPGGKILDLGCGAGQLTLPLAHYGFALDAVDINPRALEAAASQSQGLKVQWQEADIRDFDFKDAPYGGVVCQNVLPFVSKSEAEDVLNKCLNALDTGGLLMFSTFSPLDPSADGHLAHNQAGERQPTSTFTLDEVLAFLPGWEIHFAFEDTIDDDHPPHGPHTHGITQVIAQKPRVASLDSEPIDWGALPVLGTGMGWRSPLRETITTPGNVDFLEIITDDYTDPRFDRFLLDLYHEFPLVLHGVELSIGSTEGVDPQYLEDIKRLIQRCQSPWWSDHLCFTQAGDYKTFALNPLPCTEEALETVIRNIKAVQKEIHAPLLLENVAYYHRSDWGKMSDGEFMRRICEATDTGILLDVANLFGNSYNLQLNPEQFLKELPKDRVVQLHLAGGRMIQDMLFDSHDRPIWQETWTLLKEVIRDFDIKAISIERDSSFDTSEDVVGDLKTARQLFGVRV